MISQLVLTAVIIALLVERMIREKQIREQNKDFTRAIMAKNLNEVTSAEATEKINEEFTPSEDPDLKPLSQVDNEEFNNLIKEEAG